MREPHIPSPMDTAWSAFLGAVQGATEFLPVSSSGHLAACTIFAPRLGIEAGGLSSPMFLGVLLHVATLFAVLTYFRKDALNALTGLFRGAQAVFAGRFREALATDEGVALACAVCLGTVPTAAIGLLLEGPTAWISGAPQQLGILFILCAAILVVSFVVQGGTRKIDVRAALIIGTVQGLAVLPGISRSGVTIVAALILGLSREDAVRFSFLLSVPAVAGAAILEIDADALSSTSDMAAIAVGFAVAFAVGLCAIALVRKVVRGGRLWLFAPYVAAVGTLLLVAG